MLTEKKRMQNRNSQIWPPTHTYIHTTLIEKKKRKRENYRKYHQKLSLFESLDFGNYFSFDFFKLSTISNDNHALFL